MPLTIVTINILSDLSLWKARRDLLVEQLTEIQPDILALQEVNLQAENAGWLSKQLGMPYIHLTPKTGEASREEGIAILSRIPFERQENLDLNTQNRVAQCVQVHVEGRPVLFANTHLYWRPVDAEERQEQVRRLQDWLANLETDLQAQAPVVIVCGDFNATPDTQSIQLMKNKFISAYEDYNGREPVYTTPTPLPRSKVAMLKTLFRFMGDIRLNQITLNWKGTLDYIFFKPGVRVERCKLVLDKPAAGQPKIYPSDHYGLFARFLLNENRTNIPSGGSGDDD